MQSADTQLLPIVLVAGMSLLYLVVVFEYLKRGRRLSFLLRTGVGDHIPGWGARYARTATTRVRSALLHGLLLSSVLGFFWVVQLLVHGSPVLNSILIMFPLLPLTFLIGFVLGYQEDVIPPAQRTHGTTLRLRAAMEWLVRERRSGSASASAALDSLLMREDELGESARQMWKEMEER